MGLLYRAERALRGWRARLHALRGGPIGAWFRDGGEELMWRDLPISANEVSLDVGGYHGDWTAELLIRYGARSVIFEPVPTFAAALARRFCRNPLVAVKSAALGTANGMAGISMAEDASSMSGNGRRVQVQIIDVADIFREHAAVGCMKVNIEGAEYDLLERMEGLDLLSRVASYRIQFHGGDNAMHRRAAIRTALSKTHRLILDYPFVWERWDRVKEG